MSSTSTDNPDPKPKAIAFDALMSSARVAAAASSKKKKQSALPEHLPNNNPPNSETLAASKKKYSSPDPSSSSVSAVNQSGVKTLATSKKKRKSPDPSVAVSEINLSDVNTLTASKECGSPDPSVAVSKVSQFDVKTLAPKRKVLKKSDGKSSGVVELKKRIGLLKKKPAEFDQKSVATWEEGHRVPFAFLCLAFDMIANETGRIVITDIVYNILRTVMEMTPDDAGRQFICWRTGWDPPMKGVAMRTREHQCELEKPEY